MKRAYDLRQGTQYKTKYKRRKKKKEDTGIVEVAGKVVIPSSMYIDENKDNKDDTECKGSIIESLTEKVKEEYLYKPTKKSPYQPLAKLTTNIDNVLAEKYLYKFYLDKLFLKDLKNDPRLPNPNYKGTMKIKALVRKGYRDVRTRQAILRTRRPYYYIKYTEGQLSPALLLRQQRDLEIQQGIVKENVINMMKELMEAKDNLLTQDCVQLANKIKTYVDKTPSKLLPKKEHYLKDLYDLIGQVHFDVFRINQDMPENQTIKRINFLFGKAVSREDTRDSVIKNLKAGFMDIK